MILLTDCLKAVNDDWVERMLRSEMAKCLVRRVAVLWLAVCFFCGANAFGFEFLKAPKMPPHWRVMTDFQVPADQVKTMSNRLGANLVGVRNTVYDVDGKRVQINTIVTLDAENAEKLIIKLRTMKAEETLLQKGLTIYEFVGQNDALSWIAEGRQHLE